MNKAEFEKQNPGLKKKMMQEEAIASAELAKDTEFKEGEEEMLCEECSAPITKKDYKNNNGLCSLCLRALKL